MDKNALFRRTAFGAGKTSLNAIITPGLLLTCRQALQEGIDFLKVFQTNYHLDIYNTHLPSVFTREEAIIVKADDDAAAEASTSIHRLLRPSTDALLRIAPTAIQIKSLLLRVCLQNDRHWGISYPEDGKCHQFVFLQVTFDAAGAIEVFLRVDRDDIPLRTAAPSLPQALEDLRRGLLSLVARCTIFDETAHALSHDLQKVLDERMKRRSNKWLEYHDLELILETCTKHSKCWCVSKCVL